MQVVLVGIAQGRLDEFRNDRKKRISFWNLFSLIEEPFQGGIRYAFKFAFRSSQFNHAGAPIRGMQARFILEPTHEYLDNSFWNCDNSGSEKTHQALLNVGEAA